MTVLRRFAPFVLTAAVLYGVAPAIGGVLGAWNDVISLSPVWLVVLILTQIGSLWCFWDVQRIAVGTKDFWAVAMSNLAGGAAGRIIPGGAATTAAVQIGMLRAAGVSQSTAAVGLTAGSLLLLAALCALPVLAIPAVVFGMRVPRSLWHAVAIGAALFVVMALATVAALRSEGALRRAGRLGARVAARLHRPVQDLPERLVRLRDELVERLGDQLPRAIVAAIGRWLLDFGSLLAALAAVDARPRLSLVLLAYVAAQLLAQIPLTPGGIGVVEAGLTAALALIGVATGQAAAATLAYRLVSYWLQLPAGAVAWVIHRRRMGRAARAASI